MKFAKKVKLLTFAGPQIIQETNITTEGGDGSLSACSSLVTQDEMTDLMFLKGILKI